MEDYWKSVGRREILKALSAIPIAGFIPVLPGARTAERLYFSCSENNDLYRVATSSGIPCSRCEDAGEAVAQAPDGSGVLFLAEKYPEETTHVEPTVFQEAAKKGLRLYVEFPSFVPGLELGKPEHAPLGKNYNLLDRVVAASDAFAPALGKLRILAIHHCLYVPTTAGKPDLVLARVAGFNTAVFGLPQKGIHPILFRCQNNKILVAATKLSNFITGRYAPAQAWEHIWRQILIWLCVGYEIPPLRWTPTVRPSFNEHEGLPQNAELKAFQRGVAWYSNARLFVAPTWQQKAEMYASIPGPHPGPRPSWPIGDGSEGVLEGFSSNIEYDGAQPVGWNLRNDCTGETSMAMAFSGIIEKKAENSKIAANLNDFIYFKSSLASGPRADPKSPSFGIVGWTLPSAVGVYYGDDNARSMMGTMAVAALLKSERWDEKVLRCLLANLRTTGVLGFRHNSLTESELQKYGWKHYYDEKFVNYHPHYEAYLWACFLRAYETTQYAPFLERTETAIRMTMAAYPDQWHWSNGLQQERARMLLPLSWLIRIKDTPERRKWLERIAKDLLSYQEKCGAIREEVGSAGLGQYGPPKSNDQYGTSEAPLLQQNGDPVSDLLYTTNFAFLGLHEAAAATRDPLYIEAENKLAKFLCRVQIESQTHPELSGGWFRAFDFGRWDYWASASDWGWGPWSIETGWTQAWICSVFAMRHLKTSFWDLTASSRMGIYLNKLLPLMFGR